MRRAARRPPPRDEHELRLRALGLVGWTLAEVAAALGEAPLGGGAHTKGKAGELLERALGASGAPGAVHDFPALGIELKTIPVDAAGKPYESTFVCAVRVEDADRASWATSWARAKLAHVLFVPVVGSPRAPWAERTVAAPVFFRPTPAEDALLGADFDEILGTIGAGGIERVDARLGRARPCDGACASVNPWTRAQPAC